MNDHAVSDRAWRDDSAAAQRLYHISIGQHGFMIDVVGLYKTFPMGGRELVVLNDINLYIARRTHRDYRGLRRGQEHPVANSRRWIGPPKGTVSFEGQNLFQLTEQQQAEFRNRRVDSYSTFTTSRRSSRR